MRFDRRLLTHFEWPLPLLALAVTGMGIAPVYSATHGPGSEGLPPQALRQMGLREAMLPLLLMAVPAAAILAQPDLGSAALLGAVALTMLVAGGVRLRWLAAMAGSVVLLTPLLWPHLKPYQQQRIRTFLKPELDPLGAGYHIIQSKIAVGSGMIWGKGFLQGTQNHLNFLPEQHTDFIFSVFAEEWGLVGAMVLMVLYLRVVLRRL